MSKKEGNSDRENKTYKSGCHESIQHTDNKTGETHEHNAHGGLLGAFGPYAGSSRTVKSSVKSGTVSKTKARSAVNSVAKSRGKK